MQKGIIGKKLGMTQLFDANGKVVPVTIIEAAPALSCRRRPLSLTATRLFRWATAK